MGEGYRIIAASRGVTADEKQAITRASPSHDALCDPSSQATGVSCYPLPGGRMCIARTCRAGAEHTGRGDRIYTYNLVIDAAGYAAWAYNPFEVLRAADAAGFTAPQLKPKPVLEPATLDPPVAPVFNRCDSSRPISPPPPPPSAVLWMRHVLDLSLHDPWCVVRVEDAVQQYTEWLWCSLPGPLRLKQSVSCGIKFSMSRRRNLTLIVDEKNTTAHRLETGATHYVNAPAFAAGGAMSASAASRPPAPGHEWLDWVERRWRAGQADALSARTAQPYADITLNGLNRAGETLLILDELDRADLGRLLALADEYVDRSAVAAEAALNDELLERVGRRILAQLERSTPPTMDRHWPAIAELWKSGARGAALAWPWVERSLESTSRSAPLPAARLALAVARADGPGVDPAAHERLIGAVLERLADWSATAPEESLAELQQVCSMWQHQRPGHEHVARAAARCQPAETCSQS